MCLPCVDIYVDSFQWDNPPGCLTKKFLQAKFNDTNVTECQPWLSRSPVEHVSDVLCLSCAKQGTIIASICDAIVLNAY